MDWKLFLTEFDSYLETLIAHRCSDADFGEILRYSVLGGGKRVRPHCVFLGAKAAGGDGSGQDVLSLGAAIEFIHCYSLVHDDLPAMDNDDIRRGKPSVHKRFGEASAILAGDALQSLAMSVLSENCAVYGKRYCEAASHISKAACDMALGQVFDLRGVKTADECLSMYALKTGALIKGAFMSGAVAAGADSGVSEAVDVFASHLGLAFQLADDLLDEGEDNSVISIIGRTETERLLRRETEAALSAAEVLPNSEELKEFARLLAIRKK